MSYPFITPVVLDPISFTSYGGLTGSSSPEQLNNAFIIAEQKFSAYMGAPILETLVTETVKYNPAKTVYDTFWGKVLSVESLSISDAFNPIIHITGSPTLSRYYTVYDNTYGYLFIKDAVSSYHNRFVPVTATWTYICGFAAGSVSSNPSAMLALTLLAQSALNDISPFSFGNETKGDAGVISFSNLEYKEVRKVWARTVLGESAVANRAANLLKASGLQRVTKGLKL